MLNKVLEYVEQFQMIQEQDKIIVGMSGGADSVCLVLVLLLMREKFSLSLEIAHLHHGIRGEEADRDARYVEQFCREHHLPFHLKKVKAAEFAREEGLTVEEAGRRLRYDFFQKVAKENGGDKIAVAHNKNDQAETILFHLIRGTGLKGLLGIPPKNGQVIRPLLCVERGEIEDFLQEKGISFCMDSTNSGEDYTRNKIRNRILPYIMEEINPKAIDAISRTGEVLRQVEQDIKMQVDELEEAYLEPLEKEGGCRIRGDVFENLPKTIRDELILRAFEQVAGNKKDFSRKHREMIYGLLAGETGKVGNLPYGVVARNEYGDLYLEKACQVTEVVFFQKEVPLKNGRVYLNERDFLEISIEDYKKNEVISKKTYTKWFDYDIIKDTLQIRCRKSGDRIVVDQRGGSKKIKDYFMDEKIPRNQRDEILLLTQGQEVLWIIGYRISEAYKITENTKRVLKVRYEGGNSCGTEDQRPVVGRKSCGKNQRNGRTD